MPSLGCSAGSPICWRWLPSACCAPSPPTSLSGLALAVGCSSPRLVDSPVSSRAASADSHAQPSTIAAANCARTVSWSGHAMSPEGHPGRHHSQVAQPRCPRAAKRRASRRDWPRAATGAPAGGRRRAGCRARLSCSGAPAGAPGGSRHRRRRGTLGPDQAHPVGADQQRPQVLPRLGSARAAARPRTRPSAGRRPRSWRSGSSPAPLGEQAERVAAQVEPLAGEGLEEGHGEKRRASDNPAGQQHQRPPSRLRVALDGPAGAVIFFVIAVSFGLAHEGQSVSRHLDGAQR